MPIGPQAPTTRDRDRRQVQRREQVELIADRGLLVDRETPHPAQHHGFRPVGDPGHIRDLKQDPLRQVVVYAVIGVRDVLALDVTPQANRGVIVDVIAIYDQVKGSNYI